MTTRRFGKSSAHLLMHKASYFEDNEKHVARQRQLAAVYRRQPRRTHCMNCDSMIGSSRDFIKDGIEYVFCDQCSHLNGMHKVTTDFCESVYTADDGVDYAHNYKMADVEGYNYRMASIYIPKAEFLYTSLKGNGINPNALGYTDFGAGSGYFVGALRKLGVTEVSGSEVSQSQVQYGNAMIGEPLLKTHRLEDTAEILRSTKSEVVSMLGVLEHLQNPREALRALNNNENVKYLYLLVPMVSLTLYLEILSPEVFHRLLHGGHTHLYTDESLSYVCREFGFKRIAEWWFGTDFVDLFRHIHVTLEKTGSSERMPRALRQSIVPAIDALQLEVDKQFFSSELHIVLEKN